MTGIYIVLGIGLISLMGIVSLVADFIITHNDDEFIVVKKKINRQPEINDFEVNTVDYDD